MNEPITISPAVGMSAIGVIIALYLPYYVVRWLYEKRQEEKEGQAAVRSAKSYRRRLIENKQYDLLELDENDVVTVRGMGRSITRISVRVRSRVMKSIFVVVLPGTYFVSTGSHQNMVARARHAFQLAAHSTVTFEIAATCINAHNPIPTERDRFDGVARVSDEMVRFLERTIGENEMVVQAGVWAISDGLSKWDVQKRLSATNAQGTRQPAISDGDVSRARSILMELGIRNRL